MLSPQYKLVYQAGDAGEASSPLEAWGGAQ